MTTRTKSARAPKTVKAIATVDGRMTFGMVKFVKALGTDGVWREKITYLAQDDDKTTAWTVCESPLAALGIEPVPPSNERMLNGVLVTDVFVTGDIGHRYRLPPV